MLRALHALILVSLLGEAAYCAVQVFVVLQPEGHVGPLLGLADDVPIELLVARRLYAIEGWIAFGFACLYLGLTEVLPRRLAPTPPTA